MNKKHHSTHKGFTLMEVMVAVSIFAIVVTVGIGALLTINNSYKKAQTNRQAMDSLTYMLESMSRRIRTAKVWGPAVTNGTAQTAFMFTDQDGITVQYIWDQNLKKIIMSINNNGLPNQSIPDSPGYDLTPPGVKVTNLLFTVNGFDPSGVAKTAAYVQINVQGVVDNGKQSSNFSFQTSVSKRSLDYVAAPINPITP